jgi:hypothetical protein
MLFLDMVELFLFLEAGRTNTFASYSSWANGESGHWDSNTKVGKWQVRTLASSIVGHVKGGSFIRGMKEE